MCFRVYLGFYAQQNLLQPERAHILVIYHRQKYERSLIADDDDQSMEMRMCQTPLSILDRSPDFGARLSTLARISSI